MTASPGLISFGSINGWHEVWGASLPGPLAAASCCPSLGGPALSSISSLHGPVVWVRLPDPLATHFRCEGLAAVALAEFTIKGFSGSKVGISAVLFDLDGLASDDDTGSRERSR